MVQNLKVDIIYHCSASDFEMEFNLCGCCRMRMLSDKTNDKKSFVKALARDVSRSRVIIACGPLFGADGLINIVGVAIGSGTCACDNKTYGINGDDEISIINGSTPLVTPDGYFGGCIIESGPQTIILLTENKAFRKTIMQNLIHPYIEEICYVPSKPLPIAPPQEEPVDNAINPEDEAFIIEPDEDYEAEPIAEVPIAPAAQTDEHNIDFIMDSDDAEDDQTNPQQELSGAFDDTYQMYTEVENPEEINERYENSYQSSESDNMFLASREIDEEEFEPKPEKIKKGDPIRSLNITIVILVLLLLLALLALAYFVILKPMDMGISTGEYLKQIFGNITATRFFIK